MHDHGQSKENHTNRIGWAFFLNVSFTIIEFVGGVLTNSTAIMADAVHDLGDSLSIGSAWFLAWLSGKSADEDFTYGYRRLSLLGAVINGLVLIVGSSWVLLQTIPRLFDPVLPNVNGMFGLAILGVLVNGFAAYKLSGGTSLNERVLNWHLLEDVLGWIAVLLVSIVLMFAEIAILDSVLAIAFTLFILFNVIKTSATAVKMFFQASPEKGLIKKVRAQLLKLDAIESVHHEHAWSLDGQSNVYTAHLLTGSLMSIPEQVQLKNDIAQTLESFDFAHTTIEFEFPDEDCRDSDDG